MEAPKGASPRSYSRVVSKPSSSKRKGGNLFVGNVLAIFLIASCTFYIKPSASQDLNLIHSRSICANDNNFVWRSGPQVNQDEKSFTCSEIQSLEDVRKIACSKIDPYVHCPISCGSCCEDDPSFTFELENKIFGCIDVKDRPSLCDEWENDTMVRSACLLSCKTCCSKVDLDCSDLHDQLREFIDDNGHPAECSKAKLLTNLCDQQTYKKHCPFTCNLCGDTSMMRDLKSIVCKDSEETFVNDKGVFTGKCKKIKKKKRLCKKESYKINCPLSCDNCDLSLSPSVFPTNISTRLPSTRYTTNPTMISSSNPSQYPSIMPLLDRSLNPTSTSSRVPSNIPSIDPTFTPTRIPSKVPSNIPSQYPSIMPSTSLSPSTCVDEPDWVVGGESIYAGMTCNQLNSQDWCDEIELLHDEFTNNKRASDACCSCGGSKYASAVPSTSPPICRDLADWYFDENETLDCETLSGDPKVLCPRFGSHQYKGWNGFEVCCACGGGTTIPGPSGFASDLDDAKYFSLIYGLDHEPSHVPSHKLESHDGSIHDERRIDEGLPSMKQFMKTLSSSYSRNHRSSPLSYTTADIEFCEDPQWKQMGVDINHNPHTEDYISSFGFSIAMSDDGNIIAGGAPYNHAAGLGESAGAVAVFERNAESSDGWVQIGQDIEAKVFRENFGFSVALSARGNILAIGNPMTSRGDRRNYGTVRIYERDDSLSLGWKEIGEIFGKNINENINDELGWSVALSASGDILAVGAPRYGYKWHKTPGFAQVYKRDTSVWTKIGDFYEEDNGDYFGWSIALSTDGNVTAIGSRGNVFVYSRDETNWTKIGDIYLYSTWQKSVALSASGDRLAIGANGNSTHGFIHIFERNTSSAIGWTQIGSRIEGERFIDEAGYSIAFSRKGDIVAISGNSVNRGRVTRIYEWNIDLGWSQIGYDINKKIERLKDHFDTYLGESGKGVALSGSGDIVGIAQNRYTNPSFVRQKGSVQVYKWCTEAPSTKPSLEPSSKPSMEPSSPKPSTDPSSKPSMEPSISSKPTMSLKPSLEPSVSYIPSSAPSDCVDDPNWKVGGNSRFSSLTCANIANNVEWCDTLSNLPDSSYNDKTVTEACCICGGSIYQSIPPSSAPSCVDAEWYLNEAQTLQCSSLAHDAENLCYWFKSIKYNGKDPYMACCSCGGNIHKSLKPSSTPSSRLTTAPSVSLRPSFLPSTTTPKPSSKPTSQPSLEPTLIPSSQPSQEKTDKLTITINNVTAQIDFTGSYGLSSTNNPHGSVVQDYGGGVVVYKNDPGTIHLKGNVWKVLRLPNTYDVTEKTELKFYAEVITGGGEKGPEGYAICLDEDTNDNTFGLSQVRCVAVGGSQSQKWSHVVQAHNNPSVKILNLRSGTEYTISLRNIVPFQSLKKANYIAVIQDNDEFPSYGECKISALELFDDTGDHFLNQSTAVLIPQNHYFSFPAFNEFRTNLKYRFRPKLMFQYFDTYNFGGQKIETIGDSDSSTIKVNGITLHHQNRSNLEDSLFYLDNIAFSGDGNSGHNAVLDGVVAMVLVTSIQNRQQKHYYLQHHNERKADSIMISSFDFLPTLVGKMEDIYISEIILNPPSHETCSLKLTEISYGGTNYVPYDGNDDWYYRCFILEERDDEIVATRFNYLGYPSILGPLYVSGHGTITLSFQIKNSRDNEDDALCSVSVLEEMISNTQTKVFGYGRANNINSRRDGTGISQRKKLKVYLKNELVYEAYFGIEYPDELNRGYATDSTQYNNLLSIRSGVAVGKNGDTIVLGLGNKIYIKKMPFDTVGGTYYIMKENDDFDHIIYPPPASDFDVGTQYSFITILSTSIYFGSEVSLSNDSNNGDILGVTNSLLAFTDGGGYGYDGILGKVRYRYTRLALYIHGNDSWEEDPMYEAPLFGSRWHLENRLEKSYFDTIWHEETRYEEHHWNDLSILFNGDDGTTQVTPRIWGTRLGDPLFTKPIIQIIVSDVSTVPPTGSYFNAEYFEVHTYSCPRHSHATVSGSFDHDFTCSCNEGFVLENRVGNTLTRADETCVHFYSSKKVTTKHNSISLRMSGETIVAVSQRTIPNPVEVDLSIPGRLLRNEGDDAHQTVHFLQPGYRHTLSIRQESTSLNYTIPAVTTCSCDPHDSDKTGRPKNVEAFQENGHVMFRFNDNSYCEDAFSFTRSDRAEEFLPEVGDYGVSFTRDFPFVGGEPCNSKMTPGIEASDELLESGLVVGKVFTYCVRAVNENHYMDQPYLMDENNSKKRTLMSSDDSCTTHRVQWEASIRGMITTGPTAGSLPIKDVKVTAVILSEEDEQLTFDCSDCSKSTFTTRGGRFDLSFKLDHEYFHGKNSNEIPVKLKFSKISPLSDETKTSLGKMEHFRCNVTDSHCVNHEFLCEEGLDNCSDEVGQIIYLKHLQFQEPVHVYDDTSIPFSGRVFIGDTNNQCPISNVEVMFKKRVGSGGYLDKTLVSGFTDSKGYYQVPAVIGTHIDYIDLRYHDHTFKPSQSDDSSFSSHFFPIEIKEGVDYINYDFVDVQKARLFVNVVGGQCNKRLGTSTIKVKVNGCDLYKGQEYIQKGSRGGYNNVPAHVLDVQVLDIKDDIGRRIQPVWNFFQGSQALVRTINLIEIESLDKITEDNSTSTSVGTTGALGKDEEKKLAEKNKDDIKQQEEKSLETVRFQYDGNLALSVTITSTMPGKVSKIECEPNPPGNADSMYSIEYMSGFSVEAKFFYELLPRVTCDVVGDDVKLQIENNVGVDENAGFDEFLSKMDETSKRLIEKCKDGCLEDILHENEVSGNVTTKRGAYWKGDFATGRPNIAKPYTKYITFTIQGGSSYIKHKAAVIVQGYYKKGKGRFFPLPTNKPIMIIRDPPGGMSYAKYENIQSTLTLKTKTKDDIEFNKFGWGIKAVVDFETKSAVGVGVEVEGPLWHKYGSVNIYDKQEKKSSVVTKETNMNSLQFSITWSYETSQDPWIAGAMSDVFVVPNLNVMYEEVYELFWNGSTCSVFTDNYDRLPVRSVFDLNAASSKPSMAFYSRYHIEYVKLPELRQNLRNMLHKNFNQSNPASLESLNWNETQEAQVQVLKSGIDGWETALKVASDNYKNYTTGSFAINEWFEKFGKDDSTNIDHIGQIDKWQDGASGLAPGSLEGDKLEDILGYEQARDELGPTKTINFSGGGNTFSMTMSREKMWSELKLDCWDSTLDSCNILTDNSDGEELIESLPIGGGITAGITYVGIGLEGHYDHLKLEQHWHHETTLEKSNNDGTSISFVLGDQDPGDDFAVDLYFDEQYGTTIFKTVGGQSKCPHESGTAKVEDPVLEILSRPPSNVFPDEDMVFELMMKNMGVGNESAFSLTVAVTDIEDGLQVILDGASHTGSRSFTNIKKDTAYKKTMVLKRGPKAYKYKALEIAMESQCLDDASLVNDATAAIFPNPAAQGKKLWNVIDKAEGKTEYVLKFIEPCPKVEWAGEFKRDRGYLINAKNGIEPLPVTVFNTNHAEGMLQNMTVLQGRLEYVKLLYRKVGDIPWLDMITDSGEVVDFAAPYANEDDYGYAIFNVKFDLASDGTYEVQIKTQCDDTGGPEDMDMHLSPIYTIVKDVVPPKQFGVVLPLRDTVLIREEITVVFTEPINCNDPFSFDVALRIEGMYMNETLGMDELLVVCEGRKISLQLNEDHAPPAERLMGKPFTVEIGNIYERNGINVYDSHGNGLEKNIQFSKSFADVDVNEASVSFTLTIDEMACSESSASSLADEIKEKVVDLLDTGNITNRITITQVLCSLDQESIISINIGPPSDAGERKLTVVDEVNDDGDNESNSNSLAMFRSLQTALEDTATTNESDRRLNVGWSKGSLSVSDMEILPSEADVLKFQTHNDDIDEEKELYRIACKTSSNEFDDGVDIIMSKLEKEHKETSNEVKQLEVLIREMEEKEDVWRKEMEEKEDAWKREKEEKEKLWHEKEEAWRKDQLDETRKLTALLLEMMGSKAENEYEG